MYYFQAMLQVLSFIFCAAFAVYSQAENIKIHNAHSQIVVSISSGAIATWQIKDVKKAAQSIYTFSGSDASLLSVQGRILGKTVSEWAASAGGWQLTAHAEDAVALSLNLPNIFTINYQLNLLDGVWQAHFRLELALHTQPQTGDGLWLEVGPGIGEQPSPGLGFAASLYSYTEAVFSANNAVLQIRLTPEQPQYEQSNADWLGIQSRYFAMVLVPQNKLTQQQIWQVGFPQWVDHHDENAMFLTVLKMPFDLAQSKQNLDFKLFAGGKDSTILATHQPSLEKLLFTQQWLLMRWLITALTHTLTALYAIVNNWGVAIILLAFLVRILIYPLAKRMMFEQKRFAQLQEKIQPELLRIKKEYKGGEQSELILQLYEKHNTSPLAGMKPMLIVLIQIPIFIALYHLLGQFFELRDQPFLWIETLAKPDQLFSFGVDMPFFGAYFNLLPALMAFTTILSIKLSPAPAIDEQASFKQNLGLAIMTLSFFLLFYSFPAGMVLYWTMANLFHVLHSLMG